MKTRVYKKYVFKVREILNFFSVEVTIYEDSQVWELHFNIAAGFTLVIVNKISMDFKMK